jgi:hypothetical protein
VALGQKKTLARRKTAGNGKFNLASNDPTGGATAQWIQKERREFVTGNNNYTDEPQEEILRKLNPATGDWEEYWRRSVQYTHYTRQSSRPSCG